MFLGLWEQAGIILAFVCLQAAVSLLTENSPLRVERPLGSQSSTLCSETLVS